MDEQTKYIEKLKKTETGLKNDKERINEFLSSLARTIERDAFHGEYIEDENYLKPLLFKLFDDTHLREEFFNNHEVINNIISIIFRNSSIVRNSDKRQEFKVKHLPLSGKFAGFIAKPTHEAIDALLNEELFVKVFT